MINLMSYPKLYNRITEFLKSGSRRLFETLKRLPKSTYFARLPSSNKPRWLLHVNLLLQVTRKKSILYIKLKQRPIQIGSKWNKNPNKGSLGNQRERLSIINPISLSISFGQKASFVALKITIRMILHCKNPTAANNQLAGRKRN